MDKSTKIWLAIAGVLLIVLCAGCKGGARNNGNNDTPTAIETTDGDDFSFDELFRIFSTFGDNIMSPKFAPQSVKDGLKDELQNNYEGMVDFSGETNQLSYSLFDGNCYDGFQMACYRYKADGHVLVILLENGGCDVSSVKYIRTYEYDPQSGNAHEVDFPLDPKPVRDDFEDMIRLAGADVASLRDAMARESYDYGFRADGLQVRLNDPSDFNEQAFHGALLVDYVWDGAEFVRNKDFKYPCIHASGFANILLGEEVPNFYFDYDPVGYGVNYTQGGDLWLINDDKDLGLEVQLEGGKVYSIEIRFPRYSVASYAYEMQPGQQQPYVGARINDCLVFDGDAPQVWMLMDGTVQIEDGMWNSRIAFRTSKESLVDPVEPAMNDRIRIEHPQFKPDALIESILIWQD